MLENALYNGIRIARLYRFQGLRDRQLIPQIPLLSCYTGIIPVYPIVGIYSDPPEKYTYTGIGTP
jgi:hypothetical protein